MKTLNITFTDAEYRRMFKAKMQYKGDTNICWRSFIIAKCCKGVQIKPASSE